MKPYPYGICGTGTEIVWKMVQLQLNQMQGVHSLVLCTKIHCEHPHSGTPMVLNTILCNCIYVQPSHLMSYSDPSNTVSLARGQYCQSKPIPADNCQILTRECHIPTRVTSAMAWMLASSARQHPALAHACLTATVPPSPDSVGARGDKRSSYILS